MVTFWSAKKGHSQHPCTSSTQALWQNLPSSQGQAFHFLQLSGSWFSCNTSGWHYNSNIRRRAHEEDNRQRWLLYAFNCWVGTFTWSMRRTQKCLKMKITWTTWVNFTSRYMKLAYMVITISSWLHQMIVMLTILFLFIWILLICHGMNDISTGLAKWGWELMKEGRRDKRRTRGKHMKNKHQTIRAPLVGVDPHLLRPEHGEQAIGDEWVYTSLVEDNTAWEALYSFLCIKLVFHTMTYTLLDRLDRDNVTSVGNSI